MAYLYIFENNAFPGNVKIGCTAKHPSARARELFTTGVPSPFYVSHTWEIPEGEMYQIEKDIHKYLRNFRANNSREFFRISAKLAHKHIEEYLSNYTDIIEKREIAKARTSAIYQWENVRENIWNESLQSAETELGYTFESLRNASNDLGVNLKNIILAIVSFGTLLIVPVVLGFLGFDFDSKSEKEIEEKRNILLNRIDEIYYFKRKEYFNNNGIKNLTKPELTIVKDQGFSWNQKYSTYI